MLNPHELPSLVTLERLGNSHEYKVSSCIGGIMKHQFYLFGGDQFIPTISVSIMNQIRYSGKEPEYVELGHSIKEAFDELCISPEHKGIKEDQLVGVKGMEIIQKENMSTEDSDVSLEYPGKKTDNELKKE